VCGCVFEVEDEVLGRIVVRKVERGAHVRDPHDEALRDALAQDVDARERARLRVDLALDVRDARVRERDGDEHDLRVDAVLGLREQVRRDERRVRGVVRDDLRRG
jgi:hypothetical protein